jgi:hypothetical protein
LVAVGDAAIEDSELFVAVEGAAIEDPGSLVAVGDAAVEDSELSVAIEDPDETSLRLGFDGAATVDMAGSPWLLGAFWRVGGAVACGWRDPHSRPIYP